MNRSPQPLWTDLSVAHSIAIYDTELSPDPFRIAFADNHRIALWIAENALNVATDLFRHIQIPNLYMSILWVLASLISSTSRAIFTEDCANYTINNLGFAGRPILRLPRASGQVAVQEFAKELLYIVFSSSMEKTMTMYTKDWETF
ncbi:hypothetical protein EDC96DRAFT_548774 [Choanephora cucurbitarum]|nr:hypothetical protein EDC96DRAFT_548774 [Choanephora cucurbitarum]